MQTPVKKLLGISISVIFLIITFGIIISLKQSWKKQDPGQIFSHLNEKQSWLSVDLLLFGMLMICFFFLFILLRRIYSEIDKQKVSEKKFSALLDAAPDATVIVNEKGHIQMVNKQLENLFGYLRGEIIGKQIEILIPPDLRDKHVHHRAGFFKEAKVRPMGAGIELKAVKKDGTNFPVEISLSPIQTTEGMLVSASLRDITTRKKSEEKFRSLLDSAPDATVIVNEQGIIQMINIQTETLFGYARNEMIGKPVEILIPPDLRDKHVHHRGNFVRSAGVRAMGAGIELNAVKKMVPGFLLRSVCLLFKLRKACWYLLPFAIFQPVRNWKTS